MAKPEWGTKRTCQNCAARFYDLKRDPIVCPKCETLFEPPPPPKPRRARAAPSAPKTVVPAAAAPAAAVDPPADPSDKDEIESAAALKSPDGKTLKVEPAKTENDKDNSVIEDPSELGEDEDDMAEVIEGMEEDKDKTES